MIHIKQENTSRIQVLDNEVLLAAFSDLKEATDYMTLTEAKLKGKSSDKKPI